MNRSCYWDFIRDLDYTEGLILQEQIKTEWVEKQGVPCLLFLEHAPVITLGRRGKRDHILLSDRELEKAGIKVIQTDRGGDVTYHGEGQLLGYPIFNLKQLRLSAQQLVERVCQAIIQGLADFKIQATYRKEFPGVWVGDRKIAFMGIRLADGISSHGFSLNVFPQHQGFLKIIPCGLQMKPPTSLTEQTDLAVTMESVVVKLLKAIGQEFQFKVARREFSIEASEEIY